MSSSASVDVDAPGELLDRAEQPLPQPRHVARTAGGGPPPARPGRPCTSLAGRSRPLRNRSMFAGSSAAARSGPSGSPMSVEVSTSPASWASPCRAASRTPARPSGRASPAAARPPAPPPAARPPRPRRPARPPGRTAAATWAGSSPPSRPTTRPGPVRTRRAVGRRVQPQLGEPHRFARPRHLAGRSPSVVAVQLLERQLLGQVVVDRARRARCDWLSIWPSWVSIWPSWPMSKSPAPPGTGHAGSREARAERILRTVPAFRPVAVVTVGLRARSRTASRSWFHGTRPEPRPRTSPSVTGALPHYAWP